jgi:hypothetical protein
MNTSHHNGSTMNKHPGKIALKVKTERTVSPPVGTVMLKAPSSATKRKNREDDDEASVCRKTPRTDTARPENDEVFIRSTVNHDLRSDDKDVLKRALASLVDILYEEDAKKRLAKQTAFFQVCGHSAVVTIMTKHAECNVLQELGIVVLTNATRDNQAIKAAVENVEGVEAILGAMKMFRNDRSIQCNGIGALLNLSDHLTSGKEFIKDLYGLPFILDIMKTFNTDDDLILWACKMIKKLARSEELRKPLVDSNVISSLAAALDAHKAHAGIQRDVREAFKYLLFMSDSLAGSDS